MSVPPIASYSFLPWAMQGLGSHLREGDQDTGVRLRASVDVTLQITGELIAGGTQTETVPRAVEMFGPGDVIGIDAASIVRSEPRHLITNFESNYLPFVEFYDEDFCWRYTPAKATADSRRLRPWLALVVLEDSEFTDRGTLSGGPLPAIEVADPTGRFPPFGDLWAWAHVHVNGPLGGNPNDVTDNANRLGTVVASDRDRAYSRLLCPRILKANTAYHAFVVPAFESGRLAGLGKDPAGTAFATQGAWAADRTDPELTLYPVYHRWYFRTGSVGDFEYLVRLLEPRTVDPQVGRRPIDVLDPGADLPAVIHLGGILRLGGALRAPLQTLGPDDREEYDRFEQWGRPYPHPFQRDLASLVNLAADYTSESPADANAATGIAEVEDDEDPIIIPPLYGRWHAQVSRLVAADADPERERWVEELNLDPRYRVAAGLGTGVVQKKQEQYMEAAWQQVGKVLEGNARIRFGQLALLTSMVWHRRELGQLRADAAERFLTVVAPVQRRVVASGLTVAHRFRESTVPPALLSTSMRKALRPRARLTRLVGFTTETSAENLVERVNAGEVSAAPPKVVAPGLSQGEQIADDLAPRMLPHWLVDLLRRVPGWRWWLLGIALLLAVLLLLVPVVGVVLAIAVVIGGFFLTRWLQARLFDFEAAGVVDPETRTPESVDELPSGGGFGIAPPGTAPPSPASGPDTPDALRFKEALRHLYAVDVAERGIPVRVRRPLDLSALAVATLEGIDPVVTIPGRVLGTVDIPGRIADQLVDRFGEVMVYPEIDEPMYDPLTDLSSEFFLPNIHLLQNNSITLLETNQKFIESYMVGLNHEFARELLWREYPTDQRGSYFRQFWDVRGFLAEPGADPEALRERLRDIPELHRWTTDSALGSHDHREAQGDKEDELVLTIRGELLKKYPTAVVYAHRGAWETLPDGSPDRGRPRRLADLLSGDPPRTLVKTPLYEAKVEPDIYFFGFDLTAEKARGETPEDPDDPGWFFVIKERPGEPRFGLDLPQDGPQGAINTWNELAWTDVVTTYTPGAMLRVGERSVALVDPGVGTEEKQQYDEDRAYRWRPDTHSAELAYILYQVPVLMAVHATEMLERGE